MFTARFPLKMRLVVVKIASWFSLSHIDISIKEIY